MPYAPSVLPHTPSFSVGLPLVAHPQVEALTRERANLLLSLESETLSLEEARRSLASRPPSFRHANSAGLHDDLAHLDDDIGVSRAFILNHSHRLSLELRDFGYGFEMPYLMHC